MILLALACTGPTSTAPDLWQADVRFTVERGVLGPEVVELAEAVVLTVGETTTYIARDTESVAELILSVEAGEVVFVRYRKGQQHILALEADCTMDGSTFGCTGLEDADDPGEAWSILDGEWSGGAPFDGQSTLQATDGFSWGITFTTEDDSWSLTDADRTLVVPWRAEEFWVLSDDGAADGPDDVELRVVATAGQVVVDRLAREGVAEGVAVDLDLLGEGELTASYESVDETGTELAVRLWDDLTLGQDEAVVTIR
ncbi:MAG: hypothetical protein GY913_29940 [Proteobacteria bacterium]|nr:hypothetical protein [Pseudomonadota bacterium]MCP4921138.1 hypothetical protein [Pseudomonadota bacterium]